MKTKRMDIRVSEDFLDLIDGLSSLSNQTRSEFIIEQCLTGQIQKLEVHHGDEEIKRSLSSLSNNINQMGRAINEMIRLFRRAEENGTVFDEFQIINFNAFTHQYKVCTDEFKKIEERCKKEQMAFYQYVTHRELLQEVIDYLEYTNPEYLEIIKNREIKKI